MMKKTITAVAVFALSASIAVAAPHEGKGRRHGRGGHRAFGPAIEQKLNFTDAQKAQAKELRARFRAENEPLHTQIQQTVADLKAARASNDSARADELKGSLKSLREQMRARRTQQREQFLSLLTAEQRTQLDAMKTERQARRQRQ